MFLIGIVITYGYEQFLIQIKPKVNQIKPDLIKPVGLC